MNAQHMINAYAGRRDETRDDCEELQGMIHDSSDSRTLRERRLLPLNQ